MYNVMSEIFGGGGTTYAAKNYKSMGIVSLPSHSNATSADLMFGGNPSLTRAKSIKKNNGRTIAGRAAGLFLDLFGASCNDVLNRFDKFLRTAYRDMWKETSWFTGNTRGAIEVKGTYPTATVVEWDPVSWFEAKTLTALKKGTHEGIEYKKGEPVKFSGGVDYSDRIPKPVHGSGIEVINFNSFDDEVDVFGGADWASLNEAYEEIKRKALKTAGLHGTGRFAPSTYDIYEGSI